MPVSYTHLDVYKRQIEGCAGKKEGQESWAELFYNTNPEIWYDDVGPKKASDFYHHYKEDIKTMASFGMTGFRFTIQWARFMKDPIAGIVDNDAVEFYRDVIHEIKKNGMKPVISLEHWDIPAILFEKYNGWVGRETVYLYEMCIRDRSRSITDLIGKVGSNFILMCMSMPVRSDLANVLFYLLRTLEDITASFVKSSRTIGSIQFIHNPVDRKFRKDRGSKVRTCLISKDQAVRFDINSHMSQCVCESLRFTQNVRFTFCLFKTCLLYTSRCV